MAIETCKTCVFSADDECHRHAPAPITDEGTVLHAYWPQIESDLDWCGEYLTEKDHAEAKRRKRHPLMTLGIAQEEQNGP